MGFFFQAEDGIRDIGVTGVQTCALPISQASRPSENSVKATSAGASPKDTRSASESNCRPKGVTAPTSRATAPSAMSRTTDSPTRSEEHTSELQSRQYLVCRLLLEKKKKQQTSL